MCPRLTTRDRETLRGSLSLEETVSSSLRMHWQPVALHQGDHEEFPLLTLACQQVLALSSVLLMHMTK